MADATLKDLNYGHPGTASYDVDTAEWLFARQLKTKSLKQLRTWRGAQVATTLATAASIQFPTPQVSANSTSIRKQVKSLLRDHPQLAAAVELVPELALVSAAIQSTTSLYDPLVGSLLSFGSITLDDRHEGPRQIAALPTGETGNILSLAILNKERLGWALDRSVWVDGPSLKDAECGYWNEEAAPIQQVSFSQSEDRSTILAVRLPSRTVLLRPVYHKRHQPVTQSPYYELPPSRIDAHPILNLNSDQTGGFSHVDVTFNPDFQFQFGIVDRSSTWSVWDIEHRLQRDAYTASCLLQGPIDPSGEASATGEDGWARILWVGDVNTLAVCNRRQLSIVSIKVGSFDYLHCPKLFSKRSTDWILDLKRHPGNKGRFFVLTSTHLMLMAITTSSEALDASVGEAGAHTLMSWRHYRGLEDFTLRLSVQTLTEDGEVNGPTY
jgi:RNA polymerase I-specific transcription initiation factor RRN6